MEITSLLPTITEHIPGMVGVYNIKTGQYLYVNKSVEKILGYNPDYFINGGLAAVSALVHPDDLPRITDENTATLTKAGTLQSDDTPIATFEYRMRHQDGSWRWLHTDGTILQRDDEGNVELILNVSIDITERKEKEQHIEMLEQEFIALQESEQRFRNFIEAVEDYAIFRLNPQGIITSWNEGIEHIFGYSEHEVLGQHFSIIFPAQDRAQQVPEHELEQATLSKSTVNEGIRVRKDGTTFYAITTTTAIHDKHGNLQGFSKIIRDITEKKEAEETIRYQALHDTLTGLANRKALDDFFAISQSMALNHHYKMALLFLDLDRFKTINDTLGHGIGDMILKEVAHRLTNAVRKVDAVARLGGDEFIILLNEISSSQDVVQVAEKILQAFVPVMRVQDQSLHVSTSIGIAMFPLDGQDIYTLLKNADTALYRAKDAGRNRYQFYNYSMNLQSVNKLSLEQDLRSVVSNQQLRMVYQPFINMKTGKVVGAEALVRWEHPTLGMLLPFDFIPLAEETGLIVSIGKWILETVCAQGKQLADMGHPLHMTLNLSGRQFAEAELVETITDALENTGFDPRLLELEITESVAMENITRTSSKLNDLKKKGIAITIDDFGTGYSSLSYLKRFPVQKLKIDKSFVKHAITDSQDATIIRTIISMGHSLGLKVCAEGVEDTQQQALLASMGCDFAQGYLISKPIPPADFITWLQDK